MTNAASPTESDPLAAIRRQLVTAAGRRIAVRRRRRRMLAATGIAVPAVVVATAGANTLGIGTGVPQIDRLLDEIAQRNHEANEAIENSPAAQKPPPLLDVRPGPGSPTAPIEVPWGDGRSATALAYVSREGAVCMAVAAPPGGDAKVVGSGNLGCSSPTLISGRLSEHPAVIGGGGYGPRTIVNGFARADVAAVRVLTPAGPVDAQLSEPLTPAEGDGTPIRAFVATWTTDVGDDGLQMDEARRIAIDPPLEVRFPDGRVERIETRGFELPAAGD